MLQWYAVRVCGKQSGNAPYRFNLDILKMYVVISQCRRLSCPSPRKLERQSRSDCEQLNTRIVFENSSIPFIDRDPELFSILLSLLRTGNLPSKAKSFEIQDIVFEAKFYGVEDLLIKSTTLTQFTAIDSLLASSPNVVAAGATDFSSPNFCKHLIPGKDHRRTKNRFKGCRSLIRIRDEDDEVFRACYVPIQRVSKLVAY
ncbi:hypothetical protein L2E82_11364 [Cichorium intybus]|uniref:Uncharacterized protein n=1 Tax=Cichorium intybus TaxID=13427 RepID=A0ACB9GE33_CICIN|nr:hypothetical protein L2E82_11364 [Cichorium intybus]